MSKLERRFSNLWEYIESILPSTLDSMAGETKALVRCKGIRSATDLLRIILTYGVTDWSLKATAAWAFSTGLGRLSSVALFYRIREARDWLSQLVATMLNEETRPTACIGLNIKIVDATTVVGPGAKGTEWRLHTGIDPTTGQIDSITLTDASVGESYRNYPIKAGEVLVGDRAYAMASGIAYVHKREGYVVARANLNSIRLCRPDRTVFHPSMEASGIPKVGVAHFDIVIPAPPEKRSRSHKPWKLDEASDWISARLLAVRTRKDTIIWVITTVPESLASDVMIMELYRIRWQIELEFKRLKSLLGLDALPSRRGPTAESWILARILAAILIERLLREAGAFSPWGYHLPKQSIFGERGSFNSVARDGKCQISKQMVDVSSCIMGLSCGSLRT